MKKINNEYYVSFEVAELLKEASFNKDVYKVYELNQNNKEIFGSIANWQGRAIRKDVLPMPTLDVAQRWLREKYKVHILINCIASKRWKITLQYFNGNDFLIKDNEFTYEEAQEVGIKKALEFELMLKKKE